MTGPRLFGLVVLSASSLAVIALFASKLVPMVTAPRAPATHSSPARPTDPQASQRLRRHAGLQRIARQRHRDRHRDAHAAASPRPRSKPSTGARVFGVSLPLLLAIEALAGALLLSGVAGTLVVRRVRARSRRRYALYELHLSTHDEAKPQDLEDTVEAIANVVRAYPADRARHGQPFIALELHYSSGASGALEWSLGVRCEPGVAVAIDGAISAAYPDVRLGHVLTPRPEPRLEATRVPGYVMRFRKERSFIYPLVAPGDDLSSPPLEAIALTQVSLGVPSLVRFQLTPAPAFFEELARRLYRQHENRLVRQERWGLPEGGLSSTLNRAEMANAERTQNRSLFWLDAVVAAGSRSICKQLAAAVQARRGENRLHRRWMVVRANLYRQRFPAATPPLVPSPRTLVSAAEVAHLLELPSARMKGVPVRRIALPRIPMPPEILRADLDEPVAIPPPSTIHDAPSPPARPVADACP